MTLLKLGEVVARWVFFFGLWSDLFGRHRAVVFCQDVSIDCPANWEKFQSSCYLFVRSPELTWPESLTYCRDLFADLVAVESPDEQIFLTEWLRLRDPTLATWYTSGFDALASGNWLWTVASPGDWWRISNNDPAWVFHDVPQADVASVITDPALVVAPASMGRALAYNFSTIAKAWRWTPVTPDRNRPFICEVPVFRAADVPNRKRAIDYGVIVSDAKKIPAAPVIELEPLDAVFDTTIRYSRNWTSFRCVASGFPKPEYLWHRVRHEAGIEVSYLIDPLLDYRYTQTDGTLTIHDPQSVKDRGEYRCSATNQFGTVLSKKVILNFGYVGDFALRREATQLIMFNGAVVPCDPPSFFPAVSFAWARDAFPNFVEENRRIFVSQDGNLYFSHVETSDEGTYQCVVKSSNAEVGKTGPFFDVAVRRQHSVGQLKIWSSFPKVFPILPVAGDNVSLECFASGYPAPQYTWRRLEGQMPVGFSMRKHDRILQIPNVQIGDSGDYECSVANVQGTVSAVLTLDINVRPVFIVPLTAQLVDLGRDVTWTCAAFGRPAVRYRWYKNGDLLDYSRIRTEEIGRYQLDGARLFIRSVGQSDEGVYQCEARNVLGTALSAGELRVLQMAPSFRKQPIDAVVYATAGGNVTISCQPEAAPTPVIRWVYNEGTLPLSPRVRLLGTGDLAISPVYPTDQGSYTCEASNHLGVDRSRGVLRVLQGPVINEVAVSDRVPIGHSAVVRCAATADPMLDLSYSWMLNGLPLILPDNPRLRTGWKERRGYLFIDAVSFADAGDYTCVVQTPIATLSHTTRIDAMGPPSPPSGIIPQSDILSPTSVFLRWTDGAANGLDVSTYRIESLTNHLPVWVVLTDIPAAATRVFFRRRSVEVPNRLQPWNSYRFRVLAANSMGFSVPSEASPSFEVPPAPPSRPPVMVGGGGGRFGVLTVTWTPLPPHEQNAPGIGYKIMYRKANSTGGVLEKLVDGNRHRAMVSVGDEEVFQPYEVQVRAINGAGDGPLSEPVVVYSAEQVPQEAPSSVQGVPFNSTAIEVSWRALPDSLDVLRGRLLGHRVKYWRRDWDQEDAWIVLFPSSENRALIKGLDPFTEYFVSVMAVNSAGNGPESEPAVARTYRSEPKEFPMGVRVRGHDFNTVAVDWRGIMTGPQEEPIEGYKVRYWRQGEHVKEAKDLTLPLEFLDGNLYTLLGGLTPGESYNLRVLGYSRGGDGRMSSPVWQFQMVFSNSASPSRLGLLPCLVTLLARTVMLKLVGFV